MVDRSAHWLRDRARRRTTRGAHRTVNTVSVGVGWVMADTQTPEIRTRSGGTTTTRRDAIAGQVQGIPAQFGRAHTRLTTTTTKRGPNVSACWSSKRDCDRFSARGHRGPNNDCHNRSASVQQSRRVVGVCVCVCAHVIQHTDVDDDDDTLDDVDVVCHLCI